MKTLIVGLLVAGGVSLAQGPRRRRAGASKPTVRGVRRLPIRAEPVQQWAADADLGVAGRVRSARR